MESLEVGQVFYNSNNHLSIVYGEELYTFNILNTNGSLYTVNKSNVMNINYTPTELTKEDFFNIMKPYNMATDREEIYHTIRNKLLEKNFYTVLEVNEDEYLLLIH